MTHRGPFQTLPFCDSVSPALLLGPSHGPGQLWLKDTTGLWLWGTMGTPTSALEVTRV